LHSLIISYCDSAYVIIVKSDMNVWTSRVINIQSWSRFSYARRFPWVQKMQTNNRIVQSNILVLSYTYRALKFAKASGLCLPLSRLLIATLSRLECDRIPVLAAGT